MQIPRNNLHGISSLVGLLLFVAVNANESVSAQTRARTTRQVQPVQLSAATTGSSTAELLETFCDSRTVKRSAGEKRIVYTCIGGSGSASSRLAAPSAGPQRAKIHADCKDNGEGSPTNCIWTCTADEESNCSSFIYQCSEKDGEVGGNKDSATCTP